MIISVTAPRKGLGQTLTSINIAAVISQIENEKVILIDTNKHCSDVGNYLSDTKITKGLDDFISMYSSNLLNKDSFNTCVKSVKNIDIMSSNECLDLNSKTIKVLLEYAKSKYETIIIDTISGKNPSSHIFFEHSDVVIVILNQSKHLVDMICKTDIYKSYKGKLVFVINRFIDKFEEKKFNFGLNQIISCLRQAGYNDSILPLAFDMEVINECNDNAVLNFVLNNNARTGKYSKQLNDIVNYLIIETCSTKVFSDSKKKKSFLNFFGVKGASPFATRL